MEKNEHKDIERMCEVSCKTHVAPCATLVKCSPDKLLRLAAWSENSVKQDLRVWGEAILSCRLALCITY